MLFFLFWKSYVWLKLHTVPTLVVRADICVDIKYLVPHEPWDEQVFCLQELHTSNQICFFYQGVAAPVGSKDHCDDGRANIQYVNSIVEHVTVLSLHMQMHFKLKSLKSIYTWQIKMFSVLLQTQVFISHKTLQRGSVKDVSLLWSDKARLPVI